MTRRPYGPRKSLKQTLTDNQRALDHMADSAGKPRLALYAPEPVKPRQRREPSGNAVPLERDVLKAVWKYLAHHPKVVLVETEQLEAVGALLGPRYAGPLSVSSLSLAH